MTVPVPGSLVYTYSADDSTTSFSYPVRFLDKAEIVVILREGLTDTVQVLGTDYTISGSSWPTGGSIVFGTAPASGKTVVIYRNTVAKQLVDLENTQRNDANAVETQLDRLAMVQQDQGRLVGTAIQPGSAGSVPTDGDDGNVLIRDPSVPGGSKWVHVTPGLGDVIAANNLADLDDKAVARNNLGLKGGATLDAPSDPDLSTDTDKLALRGDVDANLVLQYAADDTALKGTDIATRKAALNLANEGWWLPTSDDISAQITAGDPRYQPTSGDATGASGGWYQAGSVASGQKYENLGARIERLADRLMVGGEAVKFNGLADGSGGKGGFLWDLLPGATQSHAWMEQQAVLSVGGLYDVNGAVSLNAYLAGPGIALNTHLLHDRSSDTDSPSEAWCFYVDSRRDIEHGSTWGAEFDIINGLASPHTSFGPWGGSAGAVGGRTVALHLGSGGGASVNGTTYPADVALLIQKNSSTFYSGIAFGAQSLEPDAGTGRMHAIALAPKQAIDWWGSNLAAGILASIVSNVTDTSVPQELMFQDTGLNFTSGGNTLLHVNAIASAASYLTLTPTVTGGSPSVATAGAASSISLSLRSKGAATATLIQSDAVTAFSATGIASGVNRLDALAAVTGTPAQLRALGSDTNIDLQLTPKGTGNVRLGTHTALGSETVTGYITIKDAAGNARKLAVVS